MLVLMGTLSMFMIVPSARNADPFAAGAVVDPPFTSLTYAFHVFLWYNPLDHVHLHYTRTANFSHVKQIFAWEDIQPGEEIWNFSRADEVLGLAESFEIEMVVRLSDAPDWAHPDIPGEKDVDYVDAPPTDPADFGTFCGRVAARYPGRIAAYQIWNEPNLEREWGNQPPDPVAYVELLAACSNAIRAADPEAVIISAGLSPTGTWTEAATPDDMYLEAMYDADFSQYVDVVGVHAPGFSDVAYGPDDAERDGKGRWATFRRVEDMRKIMVANGDAAKQMAILEMGWTVTPPGMHPDYEWFATDDKGQADNLEAAYKWAAENWRPWMGLMTTIYIADPSWTQEDEEYWFSVVTSENWTRRAFDRLSNMEKICGDRIIPFRLSDTPEALGLAPTNPCD